VDSNPWKKRHHGVPREWRQIGEGGNAVVWEANGTAIKRLKGTATSEARARFARECSLMLSLRSRGLKVVPTREVREREGADEIVMDLLDGNLEEVIDRFRCNPAKAAAALIPVVETLATLAEDQRRIHHRDLKPTNLLFFLDETNLYIGDFGCAFLSDGERITPDQRALGAWAFRPPEYSGSRVEDVTEKGDVFSIGKVLWSMINGVAHVTFPGPVWFLPEYDLTRICDNASRTAEAMYVIARCCAIRPETRPTLRELAAMLLALTSEASSPDFTIGANVLTSEQQQEIEYAQRRAVARPFVLRLTEDFERALSLLHQSNPGSLVLQTWVEEWKRLPGRVDALLEQVVHHESDAPVMNLHRRQRQLLTRFYPDGMQGRLRFFASYGPMHQQHLSPRLTVEALEDGLLATIEGFPSGPEKGPYTSSTLAEFFTRALEAS